MSIKLNLRISFQKRTVFMTFLIKLPRPANDDLYRRIIDKKNPDKLDKKTSVGSPPMCSADYYKEKEEFLESLFHQANTAVVSTLLAKDEPKFLSMISPGVNNVGQYFFGTLKTETGDFKCGTYSTTEIYSSSYPSEDELEGLKNTSDTNDLLNRSSSVDSSSFSPEGSPSSSPRASDLYPTPIKLKRPVPNFAEFFAKEA